MKRLITMLFALCVLVPLPSHAARSWALPPEVKTISVNGYDMAYTERGQGVPVVLVHGVLNDYRSWPSQMEALSEEYRVIAVSLRHYYPEPWDGTGNDLTLRQHAADIAAFIQSLNAGPVHLLGHSRGGAVALLAATIRPELVRTLVLADPSPLNSMLPRRPEIHALEAKRAAAIETVLARYRQGDTDGGLAFWVDYVAGPGAWERMPEDQRVIRRANTWPQISLAKDTQEPFTCADASRITSPVLLITGEQSAPLYGYMHEALQPCLKQTAKAVIPDAGHLMYRQNPMAFNDEVLDFLARH